jgi:hypothetical protein
VASAQWEGRWQHPTGQQKGPPMNKKKIKIQYIPTNQHQVYKGL